MGFELVGKPGQADGRLLFRARVEGVHVHSGRTKPCPLGQRRFIGKHLPQAFSRVTRAHQHARRAMNPFQGVRQKSLPVWPHCVLQRAPMHLDGIGCPALQTARENHRTHHQMVGQSQVRGRHGADRGDIGVEVVVECRLVQLREGQSIETLIAIGHVHGEHPSDIGHMDRHTLRSLRRPVLAEQVHLMAQSCERSRQVGVVDVAARAAQQVAVED